MFRESMHIERVPPSGQALLGAGNHRRSGWC